LTKDFASKRKPATKRTPTLSRHAGPSSPPWVWFSAGLMSGIFLSALSWLALQQPDVIAIAQSKIPVLTGELGGQESTGPRFDFYTLLPEQRVDVDIEPANITEAEAARRNDQYLLQAGSFMQADDADRRRAELILLGLEAHVEDTTGDNGRWHRVYIGPFESRSRLAKARSMTAQRGIDTLLLRRPRPDQG
jgi:hypothetical protein